MAIFSLSFFVSEVVAAPGEQYQCQETKVVRMIGDNAELLEPSSFLMTWLNNQIQFQNTSLWKYAFNVRVPRAETFEAYMPVQIIYFSESKMSMSRISFIDGAIYSGKAICSRL
tara:strand:- start:79 stop:420 length:342 start_codon:yes stop_codon:yes gene_type:complete